MIDDKYKYILTIAEKKSFSKAAETLYISQPHLSHLIASVEKELKIQIFNRKKRPLVLTKDGEIYVKYMNQIISLENQMLETLQKNRLHKALTINLGMGPARTPLVAPLVLKYFKVHYPDTTINIVEDNSNNELLKKVANNTLQLAFYTSPNPSTEVNCISLYKELLWLVLPEEIARTIGKNKKILLTKDLQDLEDNQFLVLDTSYGLGQYAREFFSKFNFHPRKIFTVKNLESLQSLAGSGIGITLLPTTWKNQSLSLERPKYFKIGQPPFTREIYMIYPRNHNLTEEEKTICQLCSSIVSNAK